MSRLDRRVQLVLDEERYQRVAKEAARSGRSVAAVIRGAIDVALPSGDELRVVAARQLLAMTATPGGSRGEGPAEFKRALTRVLDDKLLRN